MDTRSKDVYAKNKEAYIAGDPDKKIGEIGCKHAANGGKYQMSCVNVRDPPTLENTEPSPE